MRPLSRSLSVVLLVGYLVATVAVAGEQECDGPYKGRTLTPEELAAVLRNHEAWLKSGAKPDDTRRANLCQADAVRGEPPEGRPAQGQPPGGRPAGGANLQEADLSGANLQKAAIHGTELQKANLSRANLQEADLLASCRGPTFHGPTSGGWTEGVNLAGAIYEPKPGTAPKLLDPDRSRQQSGDAGLHNSPAALIELREAFKKGGMRTQERQLTYAIEHTKQLQAWDPSWYDPRTEDTRPWLEKLAGKSESLFSYVLFELPSGYGMVPSRALATLGLLILVFSLVYMVALVTARGRAGIWVTWPTDRVYQEEGAKEAARVTTTFFFPRCAGTGGGALVGRAPPWGVPPAHRPVLQPPVRLFPRLAGAQRRHLDRPRAAPRVRAARHRLGAHGGRHPVAPQRLSAGAVGLDLLRPAVRVIWPP